MKAIHVIMSGILFLLTLAAPLVNWIFILSPLREGMTAAITAETTILTRVSIVIHVSASLFVMLLAYHLYMMFRNKGKGIPVLALILKTSEGLMILCLALVQYMVYSMSVPGSLIGQLHLWYLDNYISFTALPGILMGLSMMLFSLLFYATRIIPAWLSWLGILSNILVIFYDISIILSLEIVQVPLVQLIGSLPVVAFQAITGSCLIIKSRKL